MKDDPSTPQPLATRADEIYFAAFEIEDEAERRTYVKDVCAGDDDLHQEVLRLFGMEEQANQLFEAGRPVRLTAADIAHTLTDIPEFFENMKSKLPDDDEIGKQIGNYKLLQKIGEGGGGNVYLAEQSKPVRRQVAFKIIKIGMDTKSVIARFEAERQALAMMEHPNIAHVLNAGETDTGRPYFVMELVQGERITTYCDANNLNIRQRMKLFIEVCYAIQHAHQKGIIHRDIKPSNVLITMRDGEPSPIVIDFGIAKATGEALLTDKTVNTSMGPLIGTPAYMSPEQTNLVQSDIDTRSDIYSLGVLLYELIAGRTPFDQKQLLKSGIDEMCRILREEEPPRPSEKFLKLDAGEKEKIAKDRDTDPRKLAASLAGDLGWITLKALDKDRERRYETADSLAVDIEHFLTDEPVMASPPSRLYRLHKLIRRNKLAFGAALAVLAALVIGLTISTHLFIVAEKARANERALRLQAESRGKIAQAAYLISRNRNEEAEQLIQTARLDTPTIEGASVLRSLGEWQALQGNEQRAAAYYRKLLTIDLHDNWDDVSGDFLACGTVLADLDDESLGDYAQFREILLFRSGENMSVIAAARLLRAALLPPVSDSLLEQLSPLQELVSQNSKTEQSAASARNQNWWSRLKLTSCGTDHTPRLAKGEQADMEFVMGGQNIWENSDKFEFACMTMSGDFDFRLRVHNISWIDAFTRVGLMARDSASDPGSRHIMIAVNAENTFQVLLRSRKDAGTISLPLNPLPTAYGPSSWVRLQRVGSVFRTYTSDNGIDWVLIESYDSAAGSEGPLSDPLYVGIAGCAHSPDTEAVAELSDFGTATVMSTEAMLTSALLKYRSGDYIACKELSLRCLSSPEFNAPRTAIVRAILAMAHYKLNEPKSAIDQLYEGRQMIESHYAAGSGMDDRGSDLWIDWMYARILLREAESLIRTHAPIH